MLLARSIDRESASLDALTYDILKTKEIHRDEERSRVLSVAHALAVLHGPGQPIGQHAMGASPRHQSLL